MKGYGLTAFLRSSFIMGIGFAITYRGGFLKKDSGIGLTLPIVDAFLELGVKIS